MTHEKTITKSNFPVILFVIILFITLALFFGIGVGSWRTYKDVKTFQEQSIRLQALVGVIIHLDEVLTMSARMGAETGSLQWEERYLSYEPQLDTAIKEAERLVPDSFMSKATTQTDAANIKLVTMEKQAFLLARQGQEKAASALLFSKEYDEQKQIYAEGMEQITTSMQNYVKDVVKRHRYNAYMTLIAISITLPTLIIAWIYVLRVMRNYIIRRRVADEELNKLSYAIGRVSKGDYATKLTSSSVKEIDNIVDGFNRMTQEINQRENEISGFAHIIEESLNEIYIFDSMTLKFVRVNRGARLNLGYSMEELSNLTPFDIKPEFTAESLQKMIEPLRVGEETKIEFTTVHRRKDGSSYDVEVHLQLSTFQSVPVFVAIILDITERKKAEDELRKYREHLEVLIEERTKDLMASQEKLRDTERLTILGKISGSIAHEIRNPLGVIDSSAYCLSLIHKDMDDKTNVHLDKISNSVNKCTSIIKSIQDMAILKEPHKTRVDIALLVKDSLRIANVPASVEVVIKVPEGKHYVGVDENQISMVFNNLFTNAVHAMDDTGTIWIDVYNESEKWVVVSIRDSGTGIDSEMIKTIFEPFIGTKTSGFGFGLALCKMIVERHGGVIEAQSEKGNGTIFFVKLLSNDTGC